MRNRHKQTSTGPTLGRLVSFHESSLLSGGIKAFHINPVYTFPGVCLKRSDTSPCAWTPNLTAEIKGAFSFEGSSSSPVSLPGLLEGPAEHRVGTRGGNRSGENSPASTVLGSDTLCRGSGSSESGQDPWGTPRAGPFRNQPRPARNLVSYTSTLFRGAPKVQILVLGTYLLHVHQDVSYG